MILTCPECATSYFVEDSAIGDGRMVRCASCGVSWRARQPLPLELKSSPEEGAFGAPAPEPDEELFERPASEFPGEDLPKVFRARAETDRRMREAAVQGVIWAGMGAAVAFLLIAAVVFRIDIVRAWPKAASAYAAVGLPVNRVGLSIEQVKASPSLQDGRPALVVSGVLRNIRARPVQAPPLSIVLLDKDGKRLAQRTASPGDALVQPGQTRSFAISLVDPPSAASDLEVTFTADPPALKAPAAGVGPTPKLRTAAADAPKAMVLTGPIPEAKPLPSDSKYALRGQ